MYKNKRVNPAISDFTCQAHKTAPRSPHNTLATDVAYVGKIALFCLFENN